jgi:putative IMPACT (imprinted ancient) family translation regulator
MPLKRKQDDRDEVDINADDADISRSAAIYDRESKFYALYSPSLKPKQLQSLDEIQSAAHRVVGWRRESNQQSITKETQYVVGSDDDGEKYAGKKIEKVLEAAKVSGTCVVARWFGGIMLGPVRFEHIENCAREAVRRYQEVDAERRAKKRKLEEEEEEHARLSKSLAEWDQSIVVLRALAADKEKLVKQAGEDADGDAGPPLIAAAPSSSVQPAADYEAMPLARLKALDKARDATLSFLLKRIDKAEADLKLLNNDEDPP